MAHGNKGKVNMIIFSSRIIRKFIKLLSKKVLDEILTEIKEDNTYCWIYPLYYAYDHFTIVLI